SDGPAIGGAGRRDYPGTMDPARPEPGNYFFTDGGHETLGSSGRGHSRRAQGPLGCRPDFRPRQSGLREIRLDQGRPTALGHRRPPGRRSKSPTRHRGGGSDPRGQGVGREKKKERKTRMKKRSVKKWGKNGEKWCQYIFTL